MALPSTVFKALLQVADIDHAHYVDHALTLARHPSETDERLMVRVAAFALSSHLVADLCGGDGTLTFGAGLSSPDEPDLVISDFTGRRRLWVEIGQPEPKAVARACAQADRVHVYAFGPQAEVWWRGAAEKLTRLDKLSVCRLPSEGVRELTQLTERGMQLQATVLDSTLTLSSGRGSVALEIETWH